MVAMVARATMRQQVTVILEIAMQVQVVQAVLAVSVVQEPMLPLTVEMELLVDVEAMVVMIMVQLVRPIILLNGRKVFGMGVKEVLPTVRL